MNILISENDKNYKNLTSSSSIHSNVTISQILSRWIWRAAIVCILSYIECDAHDAKTRQKPINELTQLDDVLSFLSPMAQMGLDVAHRRPRSSSFDDNYNHFVREFKHDKSSKLRSYGDTSDSSENSDESDERYAKDRKDKVKSRANVRSKADKGKKKKCKVERRLDMKCMVCFDPKNDEKSESCQLSTEPNKKNFEYSSDEKYTSKNKARDSHESNESNDSDDNESGSNENKNKTKNNDSAKKSEADEQTDLQKRPAPKPSGAGGQFKPPFNMNRNAPPRFIPFNSRAPQVFPAIYNPSPRYFNGPPGAVRYRTVNTPYGAQRVRVITLANGSQLLQATAPPTPSRQRFNPAQETRPQRDINGELGESGGNARDVHANLPWNLATPHFVESISGDWSRCRKIVENHQTCIECLQNDGRKKECMYSNQAKPDNFYKSYSTMKSYENQPYAFEMPKVMSARHVEHKTHSAYTTHANKTEANNGDHRGKGKEAAKVIQSGNSTSMSEVKKAPLTQPIDAASDVIYGIQKPEQLALFFKTAEPEPFKGKVKETAKA